MWVFLYKELKEDFEKVKPFAKAHPKEFIQGLADSEWCPSVSAGAAFCLRVIVAVSINKELLEFVKVLLKIKGMNSSLFLSKKKGMADSVINGRIITRTKNLYALQISNFEEIVKFSDEINFIIGRKNKKLKNAIFALSDSSVKNPLLFWKNNYKKKSNQWFVNQ